MRILLLLCAVAAFHTLCCHALPRWYPYLSSPLKRFLPKFLTNGVLSNAIVSSFRDTEEAESSESSFRWRNLLSRIYRFTSGLNSTQQNDLAVIELSTVDQLLLSMRKYCGYDPIDHWDLLGKEDNITVWRLKRSLLDNPESEKWPCVKCTTTIDLPNDVLGNYLIDPSNAPLLNRYCLEKLDVHHIDKNTKITWNKTKAPFNIKPFDFCTIVHCHKDCSKNIIYIISKGVIHEKVPIHKDFVRADTIFGLNILQQSPIDRRKTEFTSISHVKYTGTPPVFAWKNGFSGTISYIKYLKETCAQLYSKKTNGKSETNQS